MDLRHENPYMASAIHRDQSVVHRVPEDAEPGTMIETACGVERYFRILFRRDPDTVSNLCVDCFE
jgi:hypothetical protein